MKIPDHLIDELRRAQAGEMVREQADNRPWWQRLISSIRVTPKTTIIPPRITGVEIKGGVEF